MLDREVERIRINGYIIADTNPPQATFHMKIYDTNYGPDTFGRIRMGLITEMFLTFDGFTKPDVGDHLRISCLYKGVVRDRYTVVILKISECADEPETVLISVEAASAGKSESVSEACCSSSAHVTPSKYLH